MKNISFSDIDFTVFIHTLQGTSDEAQLSAEDIKAKPYYRDFKIKEDIAIYAVNPNKVRGEITSLADFKAMLDYILDDLYITNFKLDRLDLAINTVVCFDEIYKVNCYLAELFTVRIGAKNSYRVIGNDLKKRSIKVTSRSYDLEIYDKELQSKGINPWKTRIEFRFKRLGRRQTVEEAVHRVLEDLNALPKCVDALNEKKIKQLYDEYVKECAPDYEGRITSLPAFVSKYADHFYNMDILKGVHSQVLKGECKHWLSRYRSGGKTLTLFSKKNLRDYLKPITAAAKDYIKSSGIRLLFGGKNSEPIPA
jgi:galactokinase